MDIANTPINRDKMRKINDIIIKAKAIINKLNEIKTFDKLFIDRYREQFITKYPNIEFILDTELFITISNNTISDSWFITIGQTELNEIYTSLESIYLIINQVSNENGAYSNKILIGEDNTNSLIPNYNLLRDKLIKCSYFEILTVLNISDNTNKLNSLIKDNEKILIQNNELEDNK